jgi:Virulence factor BrkB
MVAGVCFLLLVSLTASALITAVGGYLEHLLPGGNVLAWTTHLVLDVSIVTLLFAMIFKFLPDARLSWRDVRLGAALTTALFFGRQIRAGSLSGQRRSGIRLRSGRVADHDADMDLSAAANRALRPRVYSSASLRPGTRPRPPARRHAAGLARLARGRSSRVRQGCHGMGQSTCT